MYIVYNYPSSGITEIVEIQNPDNLELFITNGMVDIWETNPFNNPNIIQYGGNKI